MAKRAIIESEDYPAKQGDYQVGYKHPPREYQFKPGHSGNPKGTPPSRCNLWRHVCKFMNMKSSELEKIIKSGNLTVVERTAIKIVKSMSTGEDSGPDGTFRMAKHFFDREEGKAVEHVIMDNQQEPPTDEECEEIRQEMRKNFSIAVNRNNNGQRN